MRDHCQLPLCSSSVPQQLMFTKSCVLGAALLTASVSSAQQSNGFDAAAAFGARQSVLDVSLSPDGKSIAYVAATAGPGSAVVTRDLAEGSKGRIALVASGKPEHIRGCNWVSADRLVCTVLGVVPSPINVAVGFFLEKSRLVAVDRSGGNMKILSTTNNEFSRAYQLSGGSVLDWLPDQEGMVLMSRTYVPDDHLGSRIVSKQEGLGVDLVDTRTLSVKTIEEPGSSTVYYVSDGRGTIRIVGKRLKSGPDGMDSGITGYWYRKQGSREWLKLSDYNWADQSGFLPLAVDHDLDIAYGYKEKDGATAIYSVKLDASLSENLVYAQPDVDVGGLIRIGRRNRVVGVSYATDFPHAVYFDPDIENLMKSLERALPHQKLKVVESSVDEQVLLVYAGSDADPGMYYVFDRPARQLHPLLAVRSELDGVKLAKVRPVMYPAADGVMVPGYLTLPAGQEEAKGLPAIVLPHGGPSARDYWGFDWLSQYFAARGFAVLQPNFRGSAGYGDAWLHDNGFKSWRVAIGDVLDAGHWLVAQGIADPARLSVLGWSYGGYAALQSAVTEPGLFKAVIAIAPVTDLEALKEEHRHWSDYRLVRDMVGEGPHVRDGSPARNADKIKVPVLLFHGGMDTKVAITQSRLMAERLSKAGVKNELITWDSLDHYLEDSDARTKMLRRSDEFLRQAFRAGQ
jgi:dipeptidyl aminopeptidase/acylaminoacyl peptidase